jgi:uncharacterized membrane protein
MNKMLVAVFDNEAAAFKGQNALKDLHRDGDISLYASAVIVKDKTGAISIKQAADDGTIGTALGLLTGGLIGILAGPAGLAVGATVGALTGSLFDLDRIGIGETFLDDVSKNLTVGKAAVLAEMEESWTTPVDTRLRELGGVVFRRLRAEVVEDQLVRESAAYDAELKALEDDLKQGVAEDRAAIQKDIEKMKKQIKATQDHAKARLDQAKVQRRERAHQGADRKTHCRCQGGFRRALKETQSGLGPDQGGAGRVTASSGHVTEQESGP